MSEDKESPVENLGQVVFGERIRPSPYKLEFLKEDYCRKTCTKTYVGGDEQHEIKLNRLKEGMEKNYQHHWIVDNMPVTWCYRSDERQYRTTRFPMGCFSKNNGLLPYSTCGVNSAYNKDNTYYLVNHVDITITYHSGEKEEWGSSFGNKGGRIIAVEAVPRSINHKSPDHPDCSPKAPPLEIPAEKLKPNEKLEITYTYSIQFKVIVYLFILVY